MEGGSDRERMEKIEKEQESNALYQARMHCFSPR